MTDDVHPEAPSETEKAITIFVCGPNTKCEHDYSGVVVEIEGGQSAVCSKCGTLAIDEAMWE